MDEDRLKQLYKKLKEDDKGSRLEAGELSHANSAIDTEAAEIYKQARQHRGRLIDFYIKYTVCTTIIILSLVVAQAVVRVMTGNGDFEIMPQWTLNIVVTGMFGQFVFLLQIVTKSVWNFKSFFDHHYEMHNGKKDEHNNSGE